MYTYFRPHILLSYLLCCLFFSCAGGRQKNIPDQTPAKLKVCPEAWYINRMPATPNPQNPPLEYMIIDGKRVEISEVDLDWVKKNCTVNQPSPVH